MKGQVIVLRQVVPALALLASLALTACSGERKRGPREGYDWVKQPGSPAPSLPDAGQTPAMVSSCAPVKGETLRARKGLTNLSTVEAASADPEPATTVTKVKITRQELWNQYEKSCGRTACHGTREGGTPTPMAMGQYRINEKTFHQRPDLGTGAVDRILHSDPDKVMPPPSDTGVENGSTRGPTDPMRILGERLRAWQEAKFPESFEITVEQPGTGPRPPGSPYKLSPEMGETLTNIGNCLPGSKIQVDQKQSEDLDLMFARAKSEDDLPETLAETDLVSLDSAVLAQRAVYSYAPTYTLFSDNAAKMRYVRVPMGQKIVFNPNTNDFDIPPNTRFYKTFLKKVIEKDGNVGYRKMETRLIVSRPDERQPDGTFQVRSLMIVYAWDKDEMMARKVTDKLKSGDLWADRLCAYVHDEREARDPAVNPISHQASETCTYMTAEELSNPASGLVRHYAIPSKERCIHCHMGSNNHSFILGFTPYHVDRRKLNEGGVYEAPTEDELGQLQRLLDYGVIEGIKPGQAKLEQSQAPRTPRNDAELTAQGYMMGNCSFCHNPHGFPSVENDVLKAFDLFPSATGGAFEFPLEKFSPRARVGPTQSLRHPYITPALGDFAGDDGDDRQSPDIKSLEIPFNTLRDGQQNPITPWLPTYPSEEEVDVKSSRFNFVGPWRSLIWRNVYTPFTYSEDSAVFIHMPRNVPGFDCRAQKIMAEWMLSIPSVPKLSYVKGAPGVEQPYQEVKPGDLPYKDVQGDSQLPPKGREYGFADAQMDALKRLTAYKNSLTGTHCPDDEDIVDALVINSRSEKKRIKSPIDEGRINAPHANPLAQGLLKDTVPDHAHWVPVDTTDARGIWKPRQLLWDKALVEGDRSLNLSSEVWKVVDELNRLFLTPDRRAFSMEPVPLGLWHPRCQDSKEAAGSKTIAQLRQTDASRGPLDMHRWLHERDPKKGTLLFETEEQTARRVHSQSRGEAVFRAICQNCHGRAMDSRSPLASTIIELTGGLERVANFAGGILGPVAAPGQHASSVFSAVGRGGTPADWQARYMVFMGMGGTSSEIPPVALKLVATSPFYGQAQTSGNVRDANMLESARNLCRDVVTARWQVIDDGANGMALVLTGQSTGPDVFLRGLGHYELWAGLCSYENVPLVRVFDTLGATTERALFKNDGFPKVYRAKDPQGRWIYPVNHPVGTMGGKAERGIQSSNRLPWCLKLSNESQRPAAIERFKQRGITREEDMPFCPDDLFVEVYGRKFHQYWDEPFDQKPNVDLNLSSEMLNAWARKGAINAGVAAYYYMDGVTKGTLKPQPAYDECRSPAQAQN